MFFNVSSLRLILLSHWLKPYSQWMFDCQDISASTRWPILGAKWNRDQSEVSCVDDLCTILGNTVAVNKIDLPTRIIDCHAMHFSTRIGAMFHPLSLYFCILGWPKWCLLKFLSIQMAINGKGYTQQVHPAVRTVPFSCTRTVHWRTRTWKTVHWVCMHILYSLVRCIHKCKVNTGSPSDWKIRFFAWFLLLLGGACVCLETCTEVLSPLHPEGSWKVSRSHGVLGPRRAQGSRFQSPFWGGRPPFGDGRKAQTPAPTWPPEKKVFFKCVCACVFSPANATSFAALSDLSCSPSFRIQRWTSYCGTQRPIACSSPLHHLLYRPRVLPVTSQVGMSFAIGLWNWYICCSNGNVQSQNNTRLTSLPWKWMAWPLFPSPTAAPPPLPCDGSYNQGLNGLALARGFAGETTTWWAIATAAWWSVVRRSTRIWTWSWSLDDPDSPPVMSPRCPSQVPLFYTVHWTLGLQVHPQKVFGPSKPTPVPPS